MTALPLVFDAPRRAMPPRHLADMSATERAQAGETLRYRCDRPHTVRCIESGRATMVCILKAAAME